MMGLRSILDFLFCHTVLRHSRSTDEDADDYIPQLALHTSTNLGASPSVNSVRVHPPTPLIRNSNAIGGILSSARSSVETSTLDPRLSPQVSGDSTTNLAERSTDHGHSTVPNQYQNTGSGLFHNAHNFDIHNGTFTSQTNNFGGDDGLKILRKRMATGARHNSAERFDPPKCHPDTRTAVIDEIMGWIKDASAPTQILCMDGPAGCGKSAIEQTLAEKCERENILAASFFFSTLSPERNHKLRFIATLAYQMAIAIQDIRPFVAKAVEKDPSITEQSLETQLMGLLVEPIRKASRAGKRGVWPFVVIIDGLDECQGEQHQAHVLRVIHMAIVTYALPFRIVLASRPEYAFRTAMDGDFHHVARRLTLDTSYNPDKDIELFFHSKLSDIQRRYKHLESMTSWPPENSIATLVDRSSGQFIYAATVVKFLDERQQNPAKRLQMVLTWKSASNSTTNPFKLLDTLYINILTYAQQSIQDPEFSLIRFLCKVLTLDRPYPQGVSTRFIDDLLQLESGETFGLLSDLHSIIRVPHLSSKVGIRPYHKSFHDFLEAPSRAGPLYVPKNEICRDLVLLYLRCFGRSDTLETNRRIESDTEPMPLEDALGQIMHSRYRDAILDDDLRLGFMNFDYGHMAELLQQNSHLAGQQFRKYHQAFCKRIRDEHPKSIDWMWICGQLELLNSKLSPAVAVSPKDWSPNSSFASFAVDPY